MKKGILIGLVAILVSGCMSKQLGAPYGFKWKQTPNELKKLNLNSLDCTEFQEGGALCTAKRSSQMKNKLFLLMFSKTDNRLMLISVQGKDSVDQDEILTEYDEVNKKMAQKYGSPVEIIETYNRDQFFLDKISDDETKPFKRVYEKEGVRIIVTIVSNSHFRKIQHKKDLVYSVMTIHSLI